MAASTRPDSLHQSDPRSRSVLIVDDSPEDREVYRRYLMRDPDYDYQLFEAELGQAALDLWQQHQPDALLLDYRLPDLDGLEILARLTALAPSACAIIIVTGQGSETLAVQALKTGAQDYLVKEQITSASLRLSINRAIQETRLRYELQQRVERERLVYEISTKINQTLDLEEILQSTVDEVRCFLQTDRVLLFQLDSSGSGTVTTESVGEGWTTLLSTDFYDPCLAESYLDRFHQGLVTVKPDIYDGSIEPCHVELLERLEVRANLVVPILQRDQLWGLLIAQHCAAPRFWMPLDIELLKQLAAQVGSALQKAELYQQTQQDLQERGRLLIEAEDARDAAESANRIKDEFLAIVSHELRTPLNPILGWSSLLSRGKLSPQKTQHALDIISRNVKVQANLIDDLLDISRILRGKLKLNPRPVQLSMVIQAAIETVQLAADAKSIQIHTQLDRDAGLISGDEARLQQIVWNLLSNAIKFTPNGGRIDVELTCTSSYAQIAVRDTGKGILPSFLPHVFDRFCQEDAATTRKFGGLGLGLAIVRYLVELHGGTVQALSPGEGKGTTFCLRLPLTSTPLEQPLDSPLAPSSGNLNNLKILVVDDDLDACEVSQFLLEDAGATVMTVNSATEALKQLSQVSFDVLVSDIGMPEIDGYELMQQVRSLPPEQGGQIRALALTAYASEIDHRRALQVGFQAHLAKPIEPDTLVQAIIKLPLTSPTFTSVSSA